MKMDFEENHLGILQNMEFMIIQVFRAHADLMDFHVDKALESLLRSGFKPRRMWFSSSTFFCS